MFYDEYFKQDTTCATKYKINYLQSILKDNCIYKFISFDDNNELNEIKLQCLQNNQLWFSYFRHLNDSTEFDILYNKEYISRRLHKSEEFIEYFLKVIVEIYDVCSFTYRYENYMWAEYANNGSGICLKFTANNLDMLYPVDYKKKEEIDFNEMIINSFAHFEQLSKLKNGVLYNDPMSLYPWVVKNPQNGKLDSTREKEIRILYSPYDNKEFNNGIINENIKEINNFYGLNVNYDQINLTLDKIIIGANCNPKLIDKIKDICVKKGIESAQQNL